MRLYKVKDEHRVPWNIDELLISANSEEEALQMASEKVSDWGSGNNHEYTGNLVVTEVKPNEPKIIMFTTV